MPVRSADSRLSQILHALDDTAGRFAALIEDAPDTKAQVPACPGWTVRDVAAHVAEATVQYGRAAWTPGPAEPAETAGPTAEAGPAAQAGARELAARLHPEVAALKAHIDGLAGPVPEFRYYDGPLVPADAGLGILLGELIIHGHDVARALGRPWPVNAAHAALVVEGIGPILPVQVCPDRAQGLTATFEIRLRGHSTHVWAFRDGLLHVNPARPGRVDVHLSADPAALLLVMYKRDSQWPHIAAGRLAAWGRKPWLAFTLGRRFRNP
jgi:uncharacterized protein (TIGR03083 family)